MAIAPDDVRRVRESLPLLREHFDATASRFYDNLFALAPEMRGLFRGDMDNQGMKFMSTMAMIAEVIGDARALSGATAGLARAHTRLGVSPEHFAPMGHALLVTLGETLGPDFTPELQSAWRAAYATLSEAMIAHGAMA